MREGATTFWEKYNPEDHGTAHLAMYGRPYGKSLCHAWGASPVYLLGKYFLGVRPVKPGYAEYEVRPVLGGLGQMEGRVPTPHGQIRVYADEKKIKVSSDEGHGRLLFQASGMPSSNMGTPVPAGEAGLWQLEILPGRTYIVNR